jgi:hypothetical protein
MVAWVSTVALVATDTIVVRSPGCQGRMVAQVATVAPRSSTAGILVLFNNSVRTAKKTTLYHYDDQFVNAVTGNNRCLHWESYDT